MTADRPDGRDGVSVTLPAAQLFHAVDPSAGSSGEAVRLLLAPALATVMMVGGFYWLHQQPPDGPIGPKQSATVMVRLLSDPAAAPVRTVPPPQQTASLAKRIEVSPDETDQTPAGAAALTQPKREWEMPAEAPVPGGPPVMSAFAPPPNLASLKFQRALLHRVAVYHRYPNAAKPQRLHGTVEALFSIRRDGTLVGVWVTSGSGAAVLDQAAIDAIQRAQPLPAIPPELPDPFTTEISLAFDPP